MKQGIAVSMQIQQLLHHSMVKTRSLSIRVEACKPRVQLCDTHHRKGVCGTHPLHKRMLGVCGADGTQPAVPCGVEETLQDLHLHIACASAHPPRENS